MSKRIYLFVPIFLVFCILFSFLSPMIVTSENISQKVFRLHILANSDSAEDQNLKLGVRDYVLQKSASIFENADSLEQAIEKTVEWTKAWQESNDIHSVMEIQIEEFLHSGGNKQ